MIKENSFNYFFIKIKKDMESLFMWNNISIRFTPKTNFDKRVIKYFNKYIKNIKISENKKFLLINSVISNLKTSYESKEMADKIYGKILNSGKKLSYAEVIFVIQYTVYLKYLDLKYDKITGEIRKGYEEFELPSLMLRLNSDDNFTASHSGKLKQLNFYFNQYLKNIVNLKSLTVEKLPFSELLYFLHIINHEMIHYKQTYEMNHNFMTDSAYGCIKNQIFSSNYSTEEWNEYKENYQFRQIEIESEILSYKDAVLLGRKYAIDKEAEYEQMIKDRKKIILEQSISFQKKSNKYCLLTDSYNMVNLVRIIKKKPEILEKFKLLQLFFNMDGSLKSEEELLKEYGENIKKDIPRSLYEEVFTYIYSFDLKASDFYIDNNIMKLKSEIIERLLQRELQYSKNLKLFKKNEIKHTMRINSKFIDNNIDNVIKIRKKRILKYYKYLKVYKFYLLQSNKIDSEILKIDHLINLAEELLRINEITVIDFNDENYEFGTLNYDTINSNEINLRAGSIYNINHEDEGIKNGEDRNYGRNR